MIDDDLRTHFAERAAGVDTSDERRRQLETELERRLATPPRRSFRAVGVAAAMLVAVGGLAALATVRSSDDELIDAVAPTTIEPTPTSSVPTEGWIPRSVDLDGVRVDFAVPQNQPESAIDRLGRLTLRLDGDDRMHVVWVGGASGSEVVAAISSSLTDSVIEPATGTTAAAALTERIVIRSDRGTTEVGVQLAASTYLRVAGADRIHRVDILTIDGDGVLVVWLDRDADSVNDSEQIVDGILSTIQVRSG